MKRLLLLTTAVILNATTITGIGENKKEAISDLSNQLSVNVKSEFKSYVKVMGDKFKKTKEKELYLTSNLPIKGVRYKNSTPIEAILSSNSIIVYKEELDRLKKEINYSKNQPKTYDNLTILLKNINSFNKNKIVATALGAKNLPTINITKSQVEMELEKLTKKVDSLQTASKIIASKIDKKNIYISLKPYGSQEVTQLASVFKDELSQYLKTTKQSDKANYFLRGNYKIFKNSIFVTFNLMDKDNNILKTITITLDKKSYQNLAYKPHTKTFDETLVNGFVKSGKLSVHIGFKGYNREDGLSFKNGDKVDIVIKTNKPICYFLVGYILHKNDKFAYLLPLNHNSINKLTGDDINQNTTIAQNVRISAPFGRETLQIFASTLDSNGQCPIEAPRCETNSQGYCVINGTPNQVITGSRGLLLPTETISSSENSISWTSFAK